MEREIKGSRIIHLSNQDLELVREKRGNINPITRVREKEIANFCNGCDQLLIDNTCRLLEPVEQGSRTLIEECNLASVNGYIGKMTKMEFIPWKKS